MPLLMPDSVETSFPSAESIAEIAATTHEASRRWSLDLNATWELGSRREMLAARIKACEAMRARLLQIEADTRLYVALCDAVAPLALANALVANDEMATPCPA